MPPPGFGPKLPKPSAKEAVKAALEAMRADVYADDVDIDVDVSTSTSTSLEIENT